MRFRALLDGWQSQIAEWLPQLTTVAVHPGPFTAAELQRLSGQTPGVYLAVSHTETNTNAAEGRRDVEVEMSAAILCRSTGRLAADDIALDIGEELLRRLPETQVVREATGATKVQLRNGFATGLAERGYTLWTLTWRHALRLGSVTDEPLPSHVFSLAEPATAPEQLLPEEC